MIPVALCGGSHAPRDLCNPCHRRRGLRGQKLGTEDRPPKPLPATAPGGWKPGPATLFKKIQRLFALNQTISLERAAAAFRIHVALRAALRQALWSARRDPRSPPPLPPRSASTRSSRRTFFGRSGVDTWLHPEIGQAGSALPFTSFKNFARSCLSYELSRRGTDRSERKVLAAGRTAEKLRTVLPSPLARRQNPGGVESVPRPRATAAPPFSRHDTVVSGLRLRLSL